MKNFTLKKLAFTLLLSISISNHIFAGKTPDSNSSAAVTGNYCGVPEDMIRMYMSSNGYVVLGIFPITGSCDAMVKTTNPYMTRVHIVDGAIIDLEDQEI